MEPMIGCTIATSQNSAKQFVLIELTSAREHSISKRLLQQRKVKLNIANKKQVNTISKNNKYRS